MVVDDTDFGFVWWRICEEIGVGGGGGGGGGGGAARLVDDERFS